MLNERRSERGKRYKAQKRSPKQEKEIAKRIGGKVVGGSGCGYAKGDAFARKLCRVEAKTTCKESYSLKLKDIDKVALAAESEEIPFMEIEFNTDPRRVVVVIEQQKFYEMLERLKHV